MGKVQVDFTKTEEKDFDRIEPNKEVEQENKDNQELKKPNQELENQDLGKILEEKKPVEDKKETITAPEISQEQVETYLKSKYFQDKEFTSIDDLLKAQEPQIKEVEKEVNPWKDVIDEGEEAYFKFKRETGNGRKEWDFIQKDINSMPILDLAHQKVKKDTGLKSISLNEAKEYLEKKLGVDFSEKDLSVADKMDLNAFVKPYKDELLGQQEQFLKPLDESQKRQKGNNEPLYTLPGGKQVNKQEYIDYQDNVKKEYIENITNGVSSATPLEFDIKLDDADSDFSFKYEFSKDDKHSMLSDAKDVDAMLEKRYKTESGFDHSQLAKGLWLGDQNNLQKVITAAVQSARAQLITELESRSNNEVFSRKKIDTSKGNKEGYGSLDQGLSGEASGFGVKTNFN